MCNTDSFAKPTGLTADDIFHPLDAVDVISIFNHRDHPVSPVGVCNPLCRPIQTNKWYGNILLGPRNIADLLYAMPYVFLLSDKEEFFGVHVIHTDDEQKVFDQQLVPQYFWSPIDTYSISFSATELGSESKYESKDVDDQFGFSLHLFSADYFGELSMTLVNGMAWVTGIYRNLTPKFWSQIGFLSVTQDCRNNQKWKITLNDGKIWLLYAFTYTGINLQLRLMDGFLQSTTGPFNGYIQLAKVPNDDIFAECIYDKYAGTYVTKMTLFGSMHDAVGRYGFNFYTRGKSGVPLHFAYLHHVQSFTPQTAQFATSIKLTTTVKSHMQAIAASNWTMLESNLPIHYSFLPQRGERGYTPEALEKITKTARKEIEEDFLIQTNLDSMYFSGKGLAKLSHLCLVAHEILRDRFLADLCLTKLKSVMNRFTSNQQCWPLVYDTTWRGIVSIQGIETNNQTADFGNTWYNDHHFHYGYFIYTASVIGMLDSSWVAPHKDWVNGLIRDVATPVSWDPFFPQSRSFDWFSGHSWATGLFKSADGKDEESISEDVNFSFACKLWSQVIGDTNLEARSLLQLAILRRTVNMYMQYTQDNTIMFKPYLPNFVAGITFMNKLHHTTWFGNNLEYIQGIYAIPITSITPYIRSQKFIQEQWMNLLMPMVTTLKSGWASILYIDYAIVSAKVSWKFFTSPHMSQEMLDPGLSLTWCLLYCAPLVI